MLPAWSYEPDCTRHWHGFTAGTANCKLQLQSFIAKSNTKPKIALKQRILRQMRGTKKGNELIGTKALFSAMTLKTVPSPWWKQPKPRRNSAWPAAHVVFPKKLFHLNTLTLSYNLFIAPKSQQYMTGTQKKPPEIHIWTIWLSDDLNWSWRQVCSNKWIVFPSS